MEPFADIPIHAPSNARCFGRDVSDSLRKCRLQCYSKAVST
jgi:hypothetical protein